jgi:predicted amidophosphoribosyltransferase
VINFLLDLVFPPLCLSCRERCLTKFLCPDCWQLCELPDPAMRCRHCFEELDRRGDLCQQCRKQKLLPIVRARVFDPESPASFLGKERVDALAGFALYQWVQLEWPLPHAVIPMPDTHSTNIARAFSEILDIPFIKALHLDCTYKEERLEEDQELLLFDVDNSLERLEKGAFALAESFPKQIYLLSL